MKTCTETVREKGKEGGREGEGRREGVKAVGCTDNAHFICLAELQFQVRLRLPVD